MNQGAENNPAVPAAAGPRTGRKQDRRETQDYISIPPALKPQPLPRETLPVRLCHLLDYANIRCFGDLDGKRLSDFAAYRGSGRVTLRQLRVVIVEALYPGREGDLPLQPLPARPSPPAKPIFEVPESARDLELSDLPVTAWLRRPCQRLGITRLGELHGMPKRRFRTEGRCPPRTLAELEMLLRRARAGEFCLPQQDPLSRNPGELLRHIDTLLLRLNEQRRSLLALRFGASGGRPLSLAQLASQQRVSKQAISGLLLNALRQLRREGSLKLRQLLETAEAHCARVHRPLNPAMVAQWQDPQRPPQYAPAFYAGLVNAMQAPAKTTRREE